ncbi:MAG: hypothetical protein JWP75_3480, partial [Frondihabitans sp.]|nr:hypothetical protein [Frondihabitans sp.]
TEKGSDSSAIATDDNAADHDTERQLAATAADRRRELQGGEGQR